MLTFASISLGKNGHYVGTALERERKEWATIGQYAPNLLGYTRATMVETMGCDSERRSQSFKLYLSSD